MRLLATVCFLALALGGSASACQKVSPAQQAKSDARQRAAFRTLVLQTATKADAIYIAKAQRVSETPRRATFHIARVLKGRAAVGDLIAYDLPNIDSIVVACGGPDEFENVYAIVGDSFIIYVVSGRLVRSAPIERGTTNLPLKEELQLIGRGHGT